MALFRRAPKGRHALGAAVTSIPSGPLQELVAAPAAPPDVVVVPAAPEQSWPQPAAEPHVMNSIAELIATGEAWSTEPPPPPAWREPVEVPQARAAVVQSVLPAPVLELELELQAAPRVQLGFRDGSTTSLDPSSSQSRALQELAQSLTRRD